ncbi:hypothetical protein BB737_06650 [Mycobacterium avium subsp. hominissuis]|uniref:hypothetical protein n=1 Tax=Mycobacterium avium TaxID=1764 RepID=UPI0004CF911C|nr:hypothetical protein [Mycobacterium avium]PBJ40599.1 hypothetical protein BI294_05925 [Mycobacterium avium subsp. hominissuis]PBJ57103.1 hypothetical protein BB736_20125 [Mycobacterium avium subsp. hominissuis]PBJ66618.1 hypothetical protein BB737_06650 [Mycobacterium avium subsp. hominissuis]
MLATPLAVQLMEPSIRDTVSKGDCRHLGGSMVGDLPPGPGQGPMTGPPNPTQWAPAFPPQPSRSRTWPAVALAAVAVLLGGAALVVALTRPTGGSSTVSSTTSTTPSYTAEQTAAAHQKLCSAFRLASDAVKTDSSGDRALGRIALTNGASLVEAAVTPALPSAEANEARALANAYRTAAAVASSAAADDPRWQAAVNDVNVKSDALFALCHD